MSSDLSVLRARALGRRGDVARTGDGCWPVAIAGAVWERPGAEGRQWVGMV